MPRDEIEGVGKMSSKSFDQDTINAIQQLIEKEHFRDSVGKAVVHLLEQLIKNTGDGYLLVVNVSETKEESDVLVLGRVGATQDKRAVTAFVPVETGQQQSKMVAALERGDFGVINLQTKEATWASGMLAISDLALAILQQVTQTDTEGKSKDQNSQGQTTAHGGAAPVLIDETAPRRTFTAKRTMLTAEPKTPADLARARQQGLAIKAIIEGKQAQRAEEQQKREKKVKEVEDEKATERHTRTVTGDQSKDITASRKRKADVDGVEIPTRQDETGRVEDRHKRQRTDNAQ